MDLPIILGSSSSSRQDIMKEMNLAYTIMKPDIDEKAIHVDGYPTRERSPPELLVLAVSRAKASALLPQVKVPSVLITCDQVVVCDGLIREKPISAEECRRYLKSYESQPAVTCSGIVVTNTATGKQAEGTHTASQSFKSIPDDVVQAVIAKGDVFFCCGGFMIDEPLLLPYLAERIGPADSILGLPKDLLLSLLAQVR